MYFKQRQVVLYQLTGPVENGIHGASNTVLFFYSGQLLDNTPVSEYLSYICTIFSTCSQYRQLFVLSLYSRSAHLFLVALAREKVTGAVFGDSWGNLGSPQVLSATGPSGTFGMLRREGGILGRASEI
jgi:hypothetical protein